MLAQSQDIGRHRLRALLEHTADAGETMAQQRQRFAALKGEGAACRAVSSFNLFQTPEPLAARLAAMFAKQGRFLEPSAGLGRLYRAMRGASAAECVLVEQSAEVCYELRRSAEGDDACRVILGDFLAQTPAELGLFDCVIMNPPFKMGTDIKHIRHAAKFLAAGGRLIALCAAGPRQRAAFGCYEWHDLPPGSFKSEGTDVATAIVVIDA
jgi:hypothetical protein